MSVSKKKINKIGTATLTGLIVTTQVAQTANAINQINNKEVPNNRVKPSLTATDNKFTCKPFTPTKELQKEVIKENKPSVKDKHFSSEHVPLTSKEINKKAINKILKDKNTVQPTSQKDVKPIEPKINKKDLNKITKEDLNKAINLSSSFDDALSHTKSLTEKNKSDSLKEQTNSTTQTIKSSVDTKEIDNKTSSKDTSADDKHSKLTDKKEFDDTDKVSRGGVHQTEIENDKEICQTDNNITLKNDDISEEKSSTETAKPVENIENNTNKNKSDKIVNKEDSSEEDKKEQKTEESKTEALTLTLNFINKGTKQQEARKFIINNVDDFKDFYNKFSDLCDNLGVIKDSIEINEIRNTSKAFTKSELTPFYCSNSPDYVKLYDEFKTSKSITGFNLKDNKGTIDVVYSIVSDTTAHTSDIISNDNKPTKDIVDIVDTDKVDDLTTDRGIDLVPNEDNTNYHYIKTIAVHIILNGSIEFNKTFDITTLEKYTEYHNYMNRLCSDNSITINQMPKCESVQKVIELFTKSSPSALFDKLNENLSPCGFKVSFDTREADSTI